MLHISYVFNSKFLCNNGCFFCYCELCKISIAPIQMPSSLVLDVESVHLQFGNMLDVDILQLTLIKT